MNIINNLSEKSHKDCLYLYKDCQPEACSPSVLTIEGFSKWIAEVILKGITKGYTIVTTNSSYIKYKILLKTLPKRDSTYRTKTFKLLHIDRNIKLEPSLRFPLESGLPNLYLNGFIFGFIISIDSDYVLSKWIPRFPRS